MSRSAKSYGMITAIIAVPRWRTLIMAFTASTSLQRNPEPKSTPRIAVVTDALFGDKGWGESSLNGQSFSNANMALKL